MKKKTKSTLNQAKEKELAKRLHDLMLKDNIKVEVFESDPFAGSTIIKLNQKDEARIIALVDYSESLNRNVF